MQTNLDLVIMSAIINYIANISKAKVLSRIFFLLIFVNLVVGTDIFMTLIGIATTPTNDLARANWQIADTETIIFDVQLEIPNSGFLAKSVKLNIQANMSHPDSLSSSITPKTSYDLILGEEFDIYLIVELPRYLSNIFQFTSYVNFEIIVQTIPQYMGITLDSLLRTFSIYGTVGAGGIVV